MGSRVYKNRLFRNGSYLLFEARVIGLGSCLFETKISDFLVLNFLGLFQNDPLYF